MSLVLAIMSALLSYDGQVCRVMDHSATGVCARRVSFSSDWFEMLTVKHTLCFPHFGRDKEDNETAEGTLARV